MSSLTPTPDGEPLEARIACTSDGCSFKGEGHAILIHNDWTFTLVGDTHEERIAHAISGVDRCPGDVSTAVAALRRALPWLTRLEPLLLGTIRERGTTWWTVPARNGCCNIRRRYYTAEQAAEHARSTQHIAALVENGVEAQVHDLVHAARQSWAGFELATTEPAPPGEVTEESDLEQLWRAGISPSRAMEAADAIRAAGAVPSVELVLAYVYPPRRRRDLKAVPYVDFDAKALVALEWLGLVEPTHQRGQTKPSSDSLLQETLSPAFLGFQTGLAALLLIRSADWDALSRALATILQAASGVT